LRHRYLTFDCYGTLVDWKTGIEDQLRAALGGVRLGGNGLLRAYMDAEKKQESGYKVYKEVLRDTVLSMSGALGRAVAPESAEEFAHSVPRWPPFPDTREFLHDAGSMGYKRYILSNVDDDLLEETIKRNGLEIDGYVTAEQIRSYKPRPAHWKEFMARTGAGRSEILHVAQSLFHDIVPTGDLGIDSAWVNRYGEAMPFGVAPLYVSDSLAHLALALGPTPA
jgi:2-haloalkanoic acid dehalogenase type II